MRAVARQMGAASTRAADSDREAVVAELRQHHAEWRPTLEELEERIGAAFSARPFGELGPPLADLPTPPPATPPTPSLWQRARPRAGYLCSSAGGSGVLAGAMGAGAHPHDRYSFSVPFLFFGFFLLRRRRRGWGGYQRSWHAAIDRTTTADQSTASHHLSAGLGWTWSGRESLPGDRD